MLEREQWNRAVKLVLVVSSDSTGLIWIDTLPRLLFLSAVVDAD